MTSRQQKAIAELQRQGLHLPAHRAAECWSEGRSYDLEASISMPREVRRLVESCNREACSLDRLFH